MAETTAIKLNIAIDLMEKYYREGGGTYGGELKKLGIKLADFVFKGTLETDRADMTEKKLLADFNRAAARIYVQMSMGIDSTVESVLKKSKTDVKNKKAVAAALEDSADLVNKNAKLEVKAAHGRLRELMDEFRKELAGKGDGEGVDFANEAAVGKFLKSLAGVADLKPDYQKFQAALDKAAGDDPAAQSDLVAEAWNAFINSDGARLLAGVGKIPKVKPVEELDPKADKAAAKQAEAVNEIARTLDWLRQKMTALADDLDKLRDAYPKLQEVLSGHAGSDPAKGPAPKTDKQTALKKQQAEAVKAYAAFPTLDVKKIDAVVASLKGAQKEMVIFKKNAA